MSVSIRSGTFDVANYIEFISNEPCDNGNYNILDQDLSQRYSNLDHIIVEAICNEKTVGFLLTLILEYEFKSNVSSISYSTLFTVRKEHRKKGVAGNLIKELIIAGKRLFNVESSYAVTFEPKLSSSKNVKMYFRPIQYSALINGGFEIPVLSGNFRNQRFKTELYFHIPTSDAVLKWVDVVKVDQTNCNKFYDMFPKLEVMLSKLCFSKLVQSFDTVRVTNIKTNDWAVFVINPYMIRTSVGKSDIQVGMLSLFVSNNPGEMLSNVMKVICKRYPLLKGLYCYDTGLCNITMLLNQKFLPVDDWKLSRYGAKELENVPINEFLMPFF
jgi:hypothetical protein